MRLSDPPSVFGRRCMLEPQARIPRAQMEHRPGAATQPAQKQSRAGHYRDPSSSPSNGPWSIAVKLLAQMSER
jgi:hypothetical protein